jgi:hypothetical protein
LAGYLNLNSKGNKSNTLINLTLIIPYT